VADKLFKDLLVPSTDAQFERFLKETKNAACIGCGETGLYEYIVIDHQRGILKCPRCLQTTDIKTMMKAWLAIRGDGSMHE